MTETSTVVLKEKAVDWKISPVTKDVLEGEITCDQLDGLKRSDCWCLPQKASPLRWHLPEEYKCLDETRQITTLLDWVDLTLEFTDTQSAIPFRELYANYVNYVRSRESVYKIDMEPLSRQSVGVMLPVYALTGYSKEIRRILKNKVVFYRGLRWNPKGGDSVLLRYYKKDKDTDIC